MEEEMDSHRPKTAAALRYRKKDDAAPRVTASGRGLMAEKILAVAAANQVPVVADPNLAELLASLDLDVEIPPCLYRAVAEVLVLIYRLEAEARDGPSSCTCKAP
jgi:flagellar biosynthesis protein